MFQRILVPTDGSDITRQAVTTAIGLARALGAKIYTVSVKEPFPYADMGDMQPATPQEFAETQEQIATECVNAVQRACSAADQSCEAHTVEGLHPWETIIEHATNMRCDLIVMASHGRRGVSALVIGSETQRVLTHSKIPVLVVR